MNSEMQQAGDGWEQLTGQQPFITYNKTKSETMDEKNEKFNKDRKQQWKKYIETLELKKVITELKT